MRKTPLILILAALLLTTHGCGMGEDSGIITTNGGMDVDTSVDGDASSGDDTDGATDGATTDTGTDTGTDGTDSSTPDETTDPVPTEYDPCKDKVCGDTCQQCDPNDLDCVETMEIKACNQDGECVSDTGDLCEEVETEYDPCDGKVCGDTCQQCDPNDLDCAETMEIKACNDAGECVSDTGDLCEEVTACSESALPADNFINDLPWAGGCGDVTLYAMPMDGTMEVVLWISGVCQEAHDAGGTITRTYNLPDAAVSLDLNIGSNVSDATCDDVLEWENPMTVVHSIAASSGTITLSATPDGEPQPWSVPGIVTVTLTDVVFTDAEGCTSTVSSYSWTDEPVGWFPG